MTNFSLKMVVSCLKWYFWGPGAPDLPFVLLNQWFRGGISRCKTGKRREITDLVEILRFPQEIAKPHVEQQFPIKTGFPVPRRARRKRRQEFKWFRGGISGVPNRKNQECTKNRWNPILNGNSVKSHQNHRISRNSTFHAVSATQGPLRNHLNSCLLLGPAGAVHGKVNSEAKREEMDGNLATLHHFHTFPPICTFSAQKLVPRCPGSPTLQKPNGKSILLGRLGGPGVRESAEMAHFHEI